MVVNDENPSSVDVVIALEATANMVSHWDIIKKQYIMPAIQYFHQQTTKNDDFLSILNGNRYGLVLFHAADRKPESATECIPPTKNLKKFIEILDNVQLNGGGGEHYSYITEGLATVLQLFEDMSLKKTNKNVEKYCFLVANTPPYQMPSVESFQYDGLTWQQLAEKLKGIDVKMSVICPRHISELQQIYLANNIKPPLMNYAQDRRHLILISGFRLPTEKEPIPVAEVPSDEAMAESAVKSEAVIPMDVTPSLSQPAAIISSTTVPIGTDSVRSGGLFSQASNMQSQVTNAFDTNVATSSVKLVINQSIASTSSGAVTSQLNFSDANVAPNVSSYANVPTILNNSVSNSVQDVTQPVYTAPMVTSNPLPQPSTNVPHPTNFVDVSSGSGVQKPIPTTSYPAAQAEANKVVEMVSQITPSQPMPPPTVQDNVVKIVWQGALEYLDKRSPGLVKARHSFPCQFLQTPNTPSQQLVIGNHWPSKMTLQLIPQMLINLVQPHLKSHKQFFMRFQPAHNPMLVNMLGQKHAYGLIQFSSPQQPESKTVILMFLKKKEDKNQFLGLLPNDNKGFFNALKQALHNYPKRQADNSALTSQTQDNSGQTHVISVTNKPSGSGIQTSNVLQSSQPRASFSQVRQYPPTQIRLTSQPRMNTPGNSTGLTSVQRMVNVPISSQQHHLTIRPQSGSAMIRNQISDTKVLGGIQTINSSGGNVQLGSNLSSGQVAMSSTPGAMSQGQRVMPNVTRVTIANKANHGLMRMQQIQAMNMQGNRPVTQEPTQLRHLLGTNNNMQQDTSMVRQTNSTNMQQPNYIQRGNNVMSGMPNNQRRF